MKKTHFIIITAIASVAAFSCPYAAGEKHDIPVQKVIPNTRSIANIPKASIDTQTCILDISFDRSGMYVLSIEDSFGVSGYSKKTTKTFLGITVKTTYDGGHAWVIDETLERRRQCIKYINGEKNSTQTQYQRLVHCNFGWEGEHNGYYYSADFNTNEDPVLKSTNVSNDQESGYYQYLLNMNTGIKG